MPLILLYYSSFERSLQKLDPDQKQIVQRILRALDAYYQSNCQLIEAQRIEPRFFYKQLRKPYFEAGVENKIRIVIERIDLECYCVLTGNHDQIKRFLSNQ